MEKKVRLEGVYKPSEDVVARDVQGEFIIIPITSGVGDMEDAIFSLNPAGRAVWERLDGKRTLNKVKESLLEEYDVPSDELEKDILGLTEELVKRKMLIACAC